MNKMIDRETKIEANQNRKTKDIITDIKKQLTPCGKLISISGPPDPDFARAMGGSWGLKMAMWLMSYGIRSKAKRRGVSYAFLFMRASGEQLCDIGRLIDAGIIRPVVDRIFPFESTSEALAYVEKGHAKGKVVVKVK